MNWWLRRIKFILSHVWRKTEIKVLVRLVVLEALRENLIHASLLASLLAVLCVPWQSLSLSTVTRGSLYVCVYVSVCKTPSSNKNVSLWINTRVSPV